MRLKEELLTPSGNILKNKSDGMVYMELITIEAFQIYIKMMMQIGVGDSFTYKREHWIIIDVREDKFKCKNKETGVIIEFNKEIIKKLIK